MIGSPTKHPLPSSWAEAGGVADATKAVTIPFGTLADLANWLDKNQSLTVLHLIMHGDAAWQNPDHVHTLVDGHAW